MLHRHPFLSLVSLAYLGLVGWLTLTPDSVAPTSSGLAMRVLARLQTYDDLSWLTYDRAEFLANVALFVPVGLFLLLVVGTRFWWVAAALAFAMTAAIETAQRSIPGRVPDERDLLSNTAGALIGIAVGVVLTLPATIRRGRARRARQTAAA
jgi:glycopeptide antibiotics resistance protein